jgi:UDP-glucose 4-epimerase
VLRLSNTYGPRAQMRHDDYGVVNWFLRRAMRREPITIHGDGRQLRDYNYVDDVVGAFLRAATSPSADGQLIHLGSGTGTSLISMIETILEIVGWAHDITRIPRPQDHDAIEYGNYVVSIERARRLLAWSPEVAPRDGLARTYAWYREDNRLEKYL